MTVVSSHASPTFPLISEENASLSDRVYDYLSEELERGRIRYGDKLNIKQIANRLDMSPMPIRDAIKRLEQEHIVEINPRSNCTVRIPTKQDILDAIDARRMIENFAVGIYYRHIRLSDLTEIDTLINDMRPYAENDEAANDHTLRAEYIELDRKFHNALCSLARNEYINRFYRIVNMHVSMSYSYGLGACHGIAATFTEHETIVNHLKAHSEEALTILDEHLQKSRRNILTTESFLALPD